MVIAVSDEDEKECSICGAKTSEDSEECPICGKEFDMEEESDTDKEKAIEHLKKISGIGEVTAEDLYKSGFESPEDIVEGGIGGLAEVSQFSFARARKILNNAKETIGLEDEEVSAEDYEELEKALEEDFEEKECPTCGEKVAEDDEECPTCGEPLVEEEDMEECPICGVKVKEGIEECPVCREPLEEEEDEEYEEIKGELEEMMEGVEEEAEEKLEEAKKSLSRARDTSINIDGLKDLMSEALQAKNDGDHSKSIDKAERLNRKAKNVAITNDKLHEAKSKVKESGLNPERYISDLKKGKSMADRGDYSGAVDIFERTIANVEKDMPAETAYVVEEEVTEKKTASMTLAGYYYAFPLFLLAVVAFEALFLLITYPDLVAFSGVLALTPAFLPLGNSLLTLSISLLAAVVLVSLTLVSVKTEGRVVKIKRDELHMSTLVGMIMAFSLILGLTRLSGVGPMYILMLILVLLLVIVQILIMWGER